MLEGWLRTAWKQLQERLQQYAGLWQASLSNRTENLREKSSKLHTPCHQPKPSSTGCRKQQVTRDEPRRLLMRRREGKVARAT